MEQLLTARGTYALFFSNSGCLAPDCREKMRLAIEHTGASLVYADEAVSLPNGASRNLLKPDWSPDTLLSCNYIGSPFAVRTALCHDCNVPGDNSETELYAFLLRLLPRVSFAYHIPEILFYAEHAQFCAYPHIVEQALRRQRTDALVTRGQLPHTVSVRYALPDRIKVSCIVISSGSVDAVRTTLESVVCRNTYPYTEFLVCDGGAPDGRKERYYDALQQFGAAAVTRIYNENNIPKLINRACERASGDALLFLPAGAVLGTHDAIERMLEFAQLADIGAVGAQYVPKGTQKPGIIHNVVKLDSVLMTRADRFVELGGFDTTFVRTGYIAAYAMLSHAMQRRNVHTPYALFFCDAAPPPPRPTEKNRLRIQDMAFAWRNPLPSGGSME